MRKPGNIVGLAAIDKAIKAFNGVASNLNDRVQDIAVAIIDHGANAGNGDMSRALTLCQAVARHRTLNVTFLIGFFRHFASTNVNLRGNDGKGKVSLMARDAKLYRGFDVAGAKANKWFDAFDADGKRSAWYAGPEPAEFQPYTVGDIAERMTRFVKTTNDLLTSKKEVKGKEVPAVQLTDDDERQVHNALQFINRIAATLARHEEVEKLAKQLETAKGDAVQDNEVIEVLAVKEKAVA